MTRLSVIPFEIRNALWGCLEIALFLTKGVTRFSGSCAAILRSVLILVLCVMLYVAILPDDHKGEPVSYWSSVVTMLLSILLSSSLFLTGMYFFKNKTMPKEVFGQFISAYNWLNIPEACIQIPVMLLAFFGVHTWDEVYIVLFFLNFYVCAYSAFFIARFFQISWYMAISLVVIDVMLGDMSQYLVSYMIRISG